MQALLGHESLETTQAYTEVDVEDLAKAVRVLDRRRVLDSEDDEQLFGEER